MVNGNNSMHLTSEQCRALMKQIDFDKLFDNLLIEYKKKLEDKTLKKELKRKEK